MEKLKKETVPAESYGIPVSAQALERKLEDYERWFKTLDSQLRSLERERQKLSAVVNHTDAGFLTLDSSRKVIWTNEVCRQWFRMGEKIGTVINARCCEVLCGKAEFCQTCPALKPLQSGTAAHSEMEIESSGETRHFYITAIPIKLPDGRVEEVIVMLQDLTDLEVLRRSQEESKAALSLLSATLDSTTDGILVVDREGKIASFNRKFVEMWRIPEPVLAARDDNRALEFVLSQLAEPEGFLAKVRELYARPEQESFDLLEFNDGRIFERYSQPQRIGGTCVGRVWSFRDISERARLENQLRQSHKIEAVGQLAGGVAHDFNNLLTAMIGYSDFILERVNADDPLRPEVEEIRKAADQAVTLTRQLLAFSRRQLLTPEVMDLNAIVASMEKMLKRIIGENIQLVTACDPELWMIKADASQMEQVIINLAVNARDALSKGGRLTIETGNVELDQTCRQKDFEVPPGQYVLLTVSDNGCGMNEETQKRIFEPFFTTKEKGKGTGLGLSTVYGIVKQSGGYIGASSQPDKGTVFKIYIPRAVGAADRQAPAKMGEAPCGSETILLVEDENAVRTLAAQALKRAGYSVLEARDGDEALQIFQNSKGIDLVLTDVVMPKLSGPEVVERLKQKQPSLKVIFMSGYTGRAEQQEKAFESGNALLPKPFTPRELARRVREVLDAGKKRLDQ